MPNLVIASPHSRNDGLCERLQLQFPRYKLIRFRDRAELNHENLTALAPEWVFFPHWSWKIPPNIHENFRCVIFHMTDLPFGRGGTPLQNLIVRGFDMTVVCALKCEDGIDAGPVYGRAPLSLTGTAEEIYQRADGCIEKLILEIVTQNPKPIPQTGEVVHFERRTPAMSDIKTCDNTQQIFDHIRMLDADGYPHAFLQTDSHHFAFRGVEKTSDGLVASVFITERKKDE